MKETLENIIILMTEKYSRNIFIYDDSFLDKTVGNRMTETSCKTIPDYLFYLTDNPTESILLMYSLNNSYIEFFRNPLTFLMLEQFVLPKIFGKKEDNQAGEIRIWSAGFAAGQEPYSLAILAEDYKSTHPGSYSFRIFATDRSEKELQSARKGIYHSKTIHNTRLVHVNKYFSNSGEFYSINENLKGIIDFSVFDLLDKNTASPPASILSCLETITHLSDKTQKVQQFVYITDMPQTLDLVVNTADGGRLRWKIENEGFNTQKNLGYELEHKYSRVSYNAMQNYYQLLQIAHMINQFTEKSKDFIELLNRHSKQTIKALWKELLTFMKSIPYDAAQLQAFMTG